MLILTAIAVALRASIIGQTTWGDELYLFEIVHGHNLGRALQIVHDTESTPPLYFVVAWLAAHLGSDDFLWIRVPSLLFSAATVPLIYVLGARTVGRSAALIGAALFAITPFDIFYGTEARTYAAVVFFSAASTLSLVELVRTGSRWWLAALAIFTAAAAYCHYLVAFVLAAQLLWALIAHRRRARLVLMGYAGAAVLYLPWVGSALFQFHDNTSDRLTQAHGAGWFAEELAKVWIGHPFQRLAQLPGRLATTSIAVGLVVAAAFTARRVIADRARPAQATGLILLLAVITPAAALIYQLGPGSIFSSRYMSASVPAGTLAIAAMLAAPRRRVVATVATALVFAGLLAGALRAIGPSAQRPDYRAVAHELDRAAPPAAPVVEPSIFSGAPARETAFYFRRTHQYFPNGRPLAPAYGLGRAARRFYVVLPQGGLGFVPYLSLEQHGFRLRRRQVWPGTARLVLLTYVPA